MSIKMRVAVLFVVSYFSGSKMGGSDNDIIFVSAQPTYLRGIVRNLKLWVQIL